VRRAVFATADGHEAHHGVTPGLELGDAVVGGFRVDGPVSAGGERDLGLPLFLTEVQDVLDRFRDAGIDLEDLQLVGLLPLVGDRS